MFHEALCSATLVLSSFCLHCVKTLDYKPKGYYMEQDAKWLGHRLWSQRSLGSNLALLHINWVILSKLFNFPNLYFLICKMGVTNCIFQRWPQQSPIPHSLLEPCHFLSEDGAYAPCF